MARTLGDAFVRVRPDTSRFGPELVGDLRRVFSQASSRGTADVLVGADTSRLPRQLQADVRAITGRVSRGGGADVEVGADTSRLPRVLQGRVLEATRRVSRSGGADVEVGADTSRLPRVLQGRVVEASRRVSRSGAGDVEVGVDGGRLPREMTARVEDATRRVERSGASEVEVRPDTARFEREVPNRIGSSIRRAAGLAAAGFATLQVGSFFKDAVTQASDLSESVNVVSLTFKDAAPELEGFFKTSAQSIGLTEAAARQAASNIGGLLNNMGYTRQESAATSKSVLTLGADLGSAFNKDPAEAVEAIGSALRGETEPIRAFNVTVDDATVKAKALEMGLYSGTGAIDKNAKAQATLALITQQTADVQGDFASTSTGLANAQRIAAAGWGNLKGVIGEGLLPAQTDLVNQVNKAVLPALTELAADKAPAVGKALGSAATQVGAFIAGLNGSGPVDGFSGKLNTAGLGARAFFMSLKDGDVTSDGFVGQMERIGAGARGLYDLITKRDYTSALRNAFGLEEDSPAVARIIKIRDTFTGTWDVIASRDTSTLRRAFQVDGDSKVLDFMVKVRDGVVDLWDAAKQLDLSQVTAALGGMVGNSEAAGDAVLSIADSAGKLLPFVIELIKQVPSFSDVLQVAAPVMGFLADHVDTLIKYMPLLVGAFIAYKVAQAAANVAATAGVVLRVAEIASRRQHSAALAANTAALGGETAAKSRGTVATIAHTVAERAQTAAKAIGTTVTTLAATAWRGLNAAMKANPIGVVITLVAALVAGLVYAYKNSETFRRIVDAAFRAVADAGKWMWEQVLKPAFFALVGTVRDAWRRFEEFRDRLSGVWAVVREVVTTMAADVVARVVAMRDRVLGFFTGLRDGARDRIATMRDWVVDVASKLLAAYLRFGTDMRDRVLGFFTGLRDGARDRISTMRDWVVDVANRLLVVYVRFGLDMRDRVLGFFTGLRDGARDRMRTMRDWVVDLVTRLRDGVVSRATGLRDTVVGAFNGLRDRGKDAFRGLRDGATRFLDGIRTAAARPVNFVITTVYMNGLRKLFNRVAGAVGLKTTLPKLDRIPERRRGGWTPKGTVLVGEEGPELVNFARPGMVYTAKQTREALREGAPDRFERPSEGVSGRTTVRPQQRAIARTGSLRVRDEASGFSVAAAARQWDGIAGLSVRAGNGAYQSVARAVRGIAGFAANTLGLGSYVDGSISLNSSAKRSSAQRQRTAMHEIGHVLGLLHPSTGRASAMKQSGSGGAMAPTAYDRESLAGLYKLPQDDSGGALGAAGAVLRAQVSALRGGKVGTAAKLGAAGLAAGASRLKAMVQEGVAGLLNGFPGGGALATLGKEAARSLVSGLVSFAGRKDSEANAAAAASGGGGGGGPLPPIVGGWMRPGRGGTITSEFGNRFHPIQRRYKLHNGIDIAGLAGSRVLAMQAGRVVQAGRVGSYGNFVQLQHANGYKTGYAHLARMLVRAGQAVSRGQQIAVEGATGGVTGKHLHQNVQHNGSWINPRRLGVYDLGGVARGAGFLPKATPRPERVLSPRQTDTYDRSLPVLERLVELVEARGLGGDQQARDVTGVHVDQLVIREDRDLNRVGAKALDALLAVGII